MDTEESNQKEIPQGQEPGLSGEESDDSDYEPVFIGEGDEDFEEIIIDAGDLGIEEMSEEGEDTEMQEEFPDESTKQFHAHEDAVYSVCFHPTNPHIFASGAGDDSAILWNLADEEKKEGDAGEPKKHQLQGHTDTVTKVAFNNTGELLATTGMDAVVKIWDTASGQLALTLEGPGESLDCCAWHPRGPVLLAGSGDGTAWMWHGKTGAMMNVFAGHSDAIVSCSFTGDGSKIVTASADITIRIWDPKTAQVTHTIREGGALNFHQQPLTIMKCHPANATLEKDVIIAGSAEGIISVSSATSGKVVNIYREHTDAVEDMVFLSFLPCVASASLDGTIQIWDINNMQTRAKIELSSGATRVVVCPAASHVIVVGCLDGTINVCDARAGKILKTLTGHTEEILDLAISGTVVASASEDKSVRLWDIQSWLAEAK